MGPRTCSVAVNFSPLTSSSREMYANGQTTVLSRCIVPPHYCFSRPEVRYRTGGTHGNWRETPCDLLDLRKAGFPRILHDRRTGPGRTRGLLGSKDRSAGKRIDRPEQTAAKAAMWPTGQLSYCNGLVCLALSNLDLLPHESIAFAGGVLKFRALNNLYVAACIGDQPRLLQNARGHGHARSSRGQHLPQHFLR